MDELVNALNALFSEIEIPIDGCPPGLEGAEVEYKDEDLQLLGYVRGNKLVVETAEEIPEGAVITWGRGRWVISW